MSMGLSSIEELAGLVAGRVSSTGDVNGEGRRKGRGNPGPPWRPSVEKLCTAGGRKGAYVGATGGRPLSSPFTKRGQGDLHGPPRTRESPGFPKFTNEVQHLIYEVLHWKENTNIFPWKSGVQLPVFMKTGNRFGKSRQLWIARHRQFLVK